MKKERWGAEKIHSGKEIEKGGNGFCEEPLKVNLLKGFEVGVHELLEDKIVTKADT